MEGHENHVLGKKTINTKQLCMLHKIKHTNLFHHVLSSSCFDISIGKGTAMDKNNNWPLGLWIEVSCEDIQVETVFASLQLAPRGVLRTLGGKSRGLSNSLPGQGWGRGLEAKCHDWRSSIGDTKELEIGRTASSMGLSTS